jgi:glutamate-ammonia-ligase adenylyltransferase
MRENRGVMSPEAAERLLEDPPGSWALALLRRHGLAEPERGARELRLVAADERLRDLRSELLPLVLGPLGEVPDPDAALGRLERLVRAGGAGALVGLRGRGPGAARALLWALGGSPFLAEQLIRHPEWAEWVTERRVLTRARGTREIAREVRAAIAVAGPAGARDALRRARRREIVRVGVRDLLRLSTVAGTLGALSALADALVQVALEVAVAEAREELGLPSRSPASRTALPGFVVLALGKLGGSELNFSSDVDLVYVHRSDGHVSRRRRALDRHAWAEIVARRLTAVLGEATHEGLVYRVDLRLRPEGRAGAISHSLDAVDDYYGGRGATWERLALLKARPLAGDSRLGREMLRRVSPFVWRRPFDADAVRQVLRMKHESDRRLVARGLEERHVKLGRGGIREIELITQVLQIRHGRAARLRLPRARGTLAALDALRSLGALAREDEDALARAYLFLRDVENKLQMAHDAQTHVLPSDDDDLVQLARRLGCGGGHAHAVARFRSDLRSHTDTVHRLFGDLLVRLVSSGSGP